MRLAGTLVSLGLPVRNGVRTLEAAVRSVLAQDHERLELVISDNASTDGTEDLCRELARRDGRIVYHRQSRNIGILNNFIKAMRLANGTFFRWIGDDDWLAPRYVSRCLEAFSDDARLILVTTQMTYTRPDGTSYTCPYHGTALRSDDPFERFNELMHLLNGMPIDPIYSLMRRGPVVTIDRRNMIREDEIFATKLSLVGPWGHVPEVLAQRRTGHVRLPVLARRLGVPRWQAYCSTTLECHAMMKVVGEANLTALQRWQARAAVANMYVLRHYRNVTHRGRRLVGLMAKRTPAP